MDSSCRDLPAAVRSTISCWPPANLSEITVSPSSCTDRMPKARSAALPSAASWRRRAAAAIGMDSVTRTLFHGSTCAGWMGMLVVSTTRPQPAGEPAVEIHHWGVAHQKTRRRLGVGFGFVFTLFTVMHFFFVGVCVTGSSSMDVSRPSKVRNLRGKSGLCRSPSQITTAVNELPSLSAAIL